MGLKAWIYHETKDPMIVEADDRESYFDDGWADSPANFVKIADFDIKPDDHIGIQRIGETVEGVAKALNGALNIDVMSKDELEEYALQHFGKDLDRRKGVKKLRVEVQAMIDGPEIH